MVLKSLHRNESIMNYICQLSGNPPFCFKYASNAALSCASSIGLFTVTVPSSGQTLLNALLCNAVLPFHASHVIVFKLEQLLKAPIAILFKLFGNFTELNAEQPENTYISIENSFTQFNKLIELNAVHLLKAYS